MAFLPPGGASQIVFSFDTTGSMSSILFEVRGRLNDMIQRLQADIPGIQIAVFAHGDYCDEKEFYVTQHVDFTDNVPELCQFVNGVSGTGGGDTDECYELVLRQVQKLSWRPNTQKSLVLIGDAMPHSPDYPLNTENIDWRDEVTNLAAQGVKIYAVQCLEEQGAETFYETLADTTGGKHLKLNQFANIFDFLMAICYREKGAEFLHGYEAEVRARSLKTGLDKDLEGLFGALRDPVPPMLTPPPSETEPVLKPVIAGPAPIPAPFVVLPVHPVLLPAVRAQRLAKPRRAAKHKQILNKYKQKRLNRGNVPQSNFVLNNLVWSSWKQVISGSKDSPNLWRKRNGTDSYRRKIAYPDMRHKAIYEFSIQSRKGARRQVVFFKVIDGLESPGSWETKLLRNVSVRESVNTVVSNGSMVFVRRSVLKRSQSVSDLKRKLNHMYNYEWIRSKSAPSTR